MTGSRPLRHGDLWNQRGVSLDIEQCPTRWGRGNNCHCDPCAVCGYRKHTAIHGAVHGEPPGGRPFGHEFVLAVAIAPVSSDVTFGTVTVSGSTTAQPSGAPDFLSAMRPNKGSHDDQQ